MTPIKRDCEFGKPPSDGDTRPPIDERGYHCGGDGTCQDGADPLGDCPDKLHPCHACGGTGRGSYDFPCTHCGGEGICYDGADPLGNCPDKLHPCHACGGTGSGRDQTIW